MKQPNRQRFAICFAGRGQALVETALMFPVQLLMLSGLAEFGFALNYYKDIVLQRDFHYYETLRITLTGDT